MTSRVCPHRSSLAALAAALIGVTVAGTPQACATNLFNLYAGAAYLRTNLRGRDSSPIPFAGSGPLNPFDRSDSGYQFTLGARGLEFLGAELDYFDLGNGSVSNAYAFGGNTGTVTDAHLAQKGEAAFAVLYLPVPIVDVYLKAGVGRITSDLGARFIPQGACSLPLPGSTNPCASETLALHTTSTGLALGAGAQWQLGNWGVRAEYERFTALGRHPDAVSIGVIWTFL